MSVALLWSYMQELHSTILQTLRQWLGAQLHIYFLYFDLNFILFCCSQFLHVHSCMSLSSIFKCSLFSSE